MNADLTHESRDDSLPEKLQAELAQKIVEGFDSVISERSKHYRENPSKVPTPSAVPFIIKSYSNMNMAITGGISLIPGPWGMAAAVPEIAIIIRNQLAMIYDIGVAHGQSEVLNKELLAGIFLSALGTSVGGLLTIHSGKFLVRRTSLRVFQRIVAILGGKVTQQVLKSMVSKWLPIVGAAAMAIWSYYSTRQIGKKALQILEKPIEIVELDSDDADILAVLAEEQAVSQTELQFIERVSDYRILKITALISLMRADGILNVTERTHIETLVEQAKLDSKSKIELIALIDSETEALFDLTLLSGEPDEATGLLVDLIALAKCDGELHPAEITFIKNASKLMGIPESDLVDVLVV
ncbi:MAG: TerB family tellurite resistance protein [Burkholderiales bacterium]|nr:TerB family tellurite resistance protein [Anaerolineae bacterium]